MADSYTITSPLVGDPSLASYAVLLTAAEATITTYTQDGEGDPVARTEIPLTNVDYTDYVLTADDINCGFVVTGTCKYIDIYDSGDNVLCRITKETAIDLTDTEGYTIDWPTGGIEFVNPITIDLDDYSIKYFRDWYLADMEGTLKIALLEGYTFDVTDQLSDINASITDSGTLDNVDYTSQVLTADDEVIAGATAQTVSGLLVYEDSGYPLCLLTPVSPVVLAGGEEVTIQWPTAGITFPTYGVKTAGRSGMGLEVGIDICNGGGRGGLSSPAASIGLASASYNKSDTDIITIPIVLDSVPVETSTCYLKIVGGKEATIENFGLGPNYDGTGTWTQISGEYETAYQALSFAPGEITKTATITIVDNPLPELDRVMTVSLSTLAHISFAGGSKTITIVDDNVDHIVNVIDPIKDHLGNANGLAALADYALDNTGATNNRVNFQAVLDYFRDSLPNTNVIFYWPNGEYQFYNAGATAINIPSVSNKMSFVGATPSVVSAPDGTLATSYALLSMPPTAIDESRILGNITTGYIWTGDTADEDRVAVVGLAFTGNAELIDDELRPTPHALEHNFMTHFGAAGDTYFCGAAVEKCYFRTSAGDGIAAWSMAHTKPYQIIGHNVMRGLLTNIGANSKTTGKHVYGSNPITGYTYSDWDVSGYDIEPAVTSAVSKQVVYLEDCVFGGGKCQIGADGMVGDRSTIEFHRVTVSPPNANMYDGMSSNCTHCDFYAYDCELHGVIGFTDFDTVEIYRTAITGYRFDTNTPSSYAEAVVAFIGRNDKTCAWKMEDCSFYFVDNVTGGLASPIYATASQVDPTDKNDSLTLINPTIDSSVNGGMVGNVVNAATGSAIRSATGGTWACDCASIGSGYYKDAACFNFFVYDDTSGPQYLTIDGEDADWSAVTRWLYVRLATANSQSKKFIKVKNLTIPAANNVISVYTGQAIAKISFVSADGIHPSAAARGATTTFTAADHGLVDGDIVICDGFDFAADWKGGLCPDSNVPFFTASGVSGANFTLALNSSGYAADYDGSDLGIISKYPLRTVVGTAGDNPVTARPAGFAGDRYTAGATNYRCKTSGVSGVAVWELEP